MDNKIKKFEELIKIMEKLRSPGGCPWDIEQTIETLKPYVIEEAYEVLEAMDEKGDKLKEELGDLLLQIIFQSRISEENGEFNIYDVIDSINSKLIRRHPHVFGDLEVNSSKEVLRNWESIKVTEKIHSDRKSVLDGIPKGLPAMAKANKIQSKAAKVGFDWENLNGAFEKMEEEIHELREAYKNKDLENIKEEIGDVIFSLINVARLSNIDAEDALYKTINKFDKRFRYIESKIDIKKSSLDEMEKYWEEAKDEIG